jgi:hypothetical protein
VYWIEPLDQRALYTELKYGWKVGAECRSVSDFRAKSRVRFRGAPDLLIAGRLGKDPSVHDYNRYNNPL